MTIEAAARMGFKGDEAAAALAMLYAVAAPDGSFVVAMDLARFVNLPLVEATQALALGAKGLRRLGISVPDGVDPIPFVGAMTAGQAEAYSHTFYGTMDVREAQGRTFTRAFRQLVESIFGPRQ